MNAALKNLSSPETTRRQADAVAARLQREHLVFEVDGLLYAVALADFDAVAEAAFTAQDAADLPAWRGVLEDQRGFVPVLSLHQILDAAHDTGTAGAATEHRLLIFRREELRCALQVHRCLGVFPLESSARLALANSRLLSVENSGCRAAVQWNGQLLVTLDPGLLISPALAVQLRNRLAPLEGKKTGARRGKLAADAAEAAGPATWEGALAGDTLAQVMQVLWMKKLTGELALDSGGSATTLYWMDGQIIHACNGAAASPQHICTAALKQAGGRFRFQRGPVGHTPRTIRAAMPSLIRDAVRAGAAVTAKIS